MSLWCRKGIAVGGRVIKDMRVFEAVVGKPHPVFVTAVLCSNQFHSCKSNTGLCVNSASQKWLGSSCAGTKRPISTTARVYRFKSFDVEKLQKYNIYDPHGNFMFASELYCVEKFCDTFKKYSFSEIDASEGHNNSKAVTELKSLQFIVKTSKEKKNPKKVKTIRIESDEAPWSVEKLKKVLLDDGEVTVDIRGKKAKSLRNLIMVEWITKSCSVSTVTDEDNKILLKLVMLKQLDSKYFKQIFAEVCEKEASFLSQVQELQQSQSSDSAK